VGQAKRHKAFDGCRFLGLAVDGTGAGRSHHKGCDLCRPHRNQKGEILGYHHQLVMLSVVGDLGLRSVARLKNNLPQLLAAAQKRFALQAPHQAFHHGRDRVEIWDADDFDPWDTLHWETVRVVRYRQHKPDGTLYEAYWLTDFSRH
jgi:hypothetical protein